MRHADEDGSIAMIHAAPDRHVGLLDTGGYYAMGEMLIRRALQGRLSSLSSVG